MAYHYVAVALGNAGDTVRETEFMKKTVSLIDRVSGFERDNIAGGYYDAIGELGKSMNAYRHGVQNYPSWFAFSQQFE